ncbi:MAG TPA: triose-phosphate isomerase family protein [Patescibacteria group bacterium]|nr:triose-phosphate isomerase family protein [Patescibacteria group bacterium]
MDKRFIIANWKSNKNQKEVQEWFETFATYTSLFQKEQLKIIICPPYPLLPACLSFITRYRLPIELGSQAVSPFSEGSYTGAVSAKLIREFAKYTIVGHSERRELFHETDEDVHSQVTQALANGLTPIVCTRGEDILPQDAKIIAYEPVAAIGTGKPASLEEVEKEANSIKEKNSVSWILYGGSVTGENAREYLTLPNISGFLVGSASLDPHEFAQIIQHA